MPTLLECLWLCVTAALAGGINALAGGGTLLTFPALFTALAGVPNGAIMANGTSTVALAPASFSSAWAFRRELAKEWRWLKLLLVPSLIGGLAGTLLVTQMDDKYFKTLVPYLILGASLLFAAQPLFAKKKPAVKDLTAKPGDEATPVPGHSKFRLAAVILFQLGVAIYGGYFGAGIGILMLSALGLMGLTNMHEMNAIKTVLAGCINGMSVAVFAASGNVHWPIAGMMMISAIAGGYLAASFGRRLPPIYIRYFVIAMGFILSVYFFYGQWRDRQKQVMPTPAGDVRQTSDMANESSEP